MSNDLSQPDWDPDISEFMRWVESQSVIGTLGPVSAVNCPFMPLPRLETYLKEGSRTRRLLGALFPHRELPVGPEDIWRNCIKVFSILLLIGKGSFIQHFVQHDQLWDAKLPFLSRPRHFPPSTGKDNFFESFSKKQWHFCPYVFRYNEINAQLEKECILPIIHKQQLGDGGSALTYKIKLHPAYDYLTASTDIRRVRLQQLLILQHLCKLTKVCAGLEPPIREYLCSENIPLQGCRGALYKRGESFQSFDSWGFAGQEHYRFLRELCTRWFVQRTPGIRRSWHIGPLSRYHISTYHRRRCIQALECPVQCHQSFEIDTRCTADRSKRPTNSPRVGLYS
jgi:hypothetical protein